MHLQLKYWLCHLKLAFSSILLSADDLFLLSTSQRQRRILATLHLFPNEANWGSESLCFSPSHRKQLSCRRLGCFNARAGWESQQGGESSHSISAHTKPITWVNSTCHASQLHSKHRDINKEPAMLQQSSSLALLQYFRVLVLINLASLLYVLGWF